MSCLSINYIIILIILWIDSLHAQSPCNIVTFKYGNVCQYTEDYCDIISYNYLIIFEVYSLSFL